MKLFSKYSRVIAYLFFGVCTTAVNVVSYYIFYEIIGVKNVPSTVIAWFLAIVFAFATNKVLVFGSKSFEKNILARELLSFFLCRFITGVFDVAIMYAAVDVLKMGGSIWKIISNIVIIVLNYVASKVIIFKNTKEENN